MIQKIFLFLFFLNPCLGCYTSSKMPEKFRGSLQINDRLHIPFMLSMTKDSMFIFNAEERIALPVKKSGDSLEAMHPVFQSKLVFTHKNDQLCGWWYNLEKSDYKMPFTAKLNDDQRFDLPPGNLNPEGRWAVRFSQNTKKEYPAVGLFKKDSFSYQMNGTFLTETGDYRYLEGIISKQKLYLSCFDMAHAYLFMADINEDSMRGIFYSGNHYKTTWEAIKNKNAKLRNSYDIIGIQSGKEQTFRVRKLNGDIMGLDDSMFRNKAVIVQLFGSWCPNCYDETIFLNELYAQYGGDALEILGIAFERPSNQKDAITKIKKFQKGLKVNYPLAYGGKSDKDSALALFTFLEDIASWPTTIYFNKEHVVVKVQSGFSGPATGKEYLRQNRESRKLVEQLIQ